LPSNRSAIASLLEYLVIVSSTAYVESCNQTLQD
jgi:hypothetical protein